MNAKTLVCTGILSACAVPALAGTRVGFGFNLGFPIYDSPRPNSVVVVPQPAESEVIPPSPGPEFAWIKGHWEWNRTRDQWVWYSGSWQKFPAPNAVWQSGYWAQQGNQWNWVDSHWAVPTAPGNPATVQNPPSAPQSAPAAASATNPGSKEVVVNEAPPAPIVEEVTVAPGPDFIWVSGQWTWNGSWVWAPGHYVRRPHPGAIWIEGAWRPGPHGWAWIGGHWR